VALATYLFAAQIYCDFSGYSDMAVGIARLMGIDLVFNFQAPYLARDIQEFWRRWHVSLSTWLRDYVFLPLGGAFQPGAREVRNILVLFLACGLWHGASWTYVIWGGLHGVYLLIWRLLGRRPPRRGPRRWVAIVITFHQVLFAWLFFRAGTLAHAGEVLRALGRPGPFFREPLLANALLPLLLMIGLEIAKDPLQLDEWLLQRRTWVALALGLVVVFLVVMFGAQAGLSFIYFKY
jgi:alginate O-acetyltransferase complex protein AlgI